MCIHNTDYDERRKIEGNEDFVDLPDCKQDSLNFRKGVKALGAEVYDIIHIRNAQYDDF